MKNGVIKQLFNTCLETAGGDQDKAGNLVADKLEVLMAEGKIAPSDLKFHQVASDLIEDYNDLRTATADDVALAVNTSQFPVITKVAIHKTILDSYTKHSEQSDVLVQDLQASRTDVEYLAGFTDTEGPELRLEQMSYEGTDLGERNVEVRMADFGRTIDLTREVIFNDTTGQLLGKAKTIGEKGGQHRSKMIMQSLEVLPRTAFKETASRAFVYKGSAVNAAAYYNATGHAAIDGRLNPNLVVSNALADYTNVQASLSLFNDMVDFNGDAIYVEPSLMIIPPELEVIAWQILHSDTFTQAAGNTATGIYHQPNPYGGSNSMKKFTPFVSRYLAGATTWYMGDPAKQLRWLWVWRPATAVQSSSDKAFFNNIITTYKFSYHGGVGAVDYLNVVKNTA